jgi:hypothetical protein
MNHHRNSQTHTDLATFDSWMEQEKTNNAQDTWSKLDKTTRMRKLVVYAAKYKEDNQLSDEEHASLLEFLRDCLDKKRLQRVKDVQYVKETGEIKLIPSLHYNRPTHHFTLRCHDKHVPTIKGLTPKRKTTVRQHAHKTIANITSDEDSDEAAEAAEAAAEEAKASTYERDNDDAYDLAVQAYFSGK